MPEDEILSPVGSGKCLLDLRTCGFMMTCRSSHSAAQACRWKQRYAASTVVPTLQQQFSNVPWFHLLNSKYTDEGGEGCTCGGKHKSSAIPLCFLFKYYFINQTEVTWQLHSSTYHLHNITFFAGNLACLAFLSLQPAVLQKGIFMGNQVILRAVQAVIFLSLTLLL